eukprot:TRINITY_DN8680_c0_g1_i1.p1 TRINITY_DN8680_c0_g1~~TRINITY_DN8680_c0_g1_i1.p1  ORF type:complete len:519 (-),score=50.93 TRINITY_DN8680_c0_g1_i1:70-1626(-)
MKRESILPEPAPPIGDKQVWSAHPRLLRHLQAFQSHPRKSALLSRYWQKANLMDRRNLLRHTCHVAAWVALLPIETTAVGQGADKLSPARVLARMLRLCRRSPFTPWLRGILHLVAIRFPEVDETKFQHWSDLRRSLSKVTWKELRDHGYAALSVAPRVACKTSATSLRDQARLVEKRQRLFDEELSRYQHLELEAKEQALESMGGLLQNVGCGSDSDAASLRRIMRETVCALAPPRAAAREQSGAVLDDDAAEHLRQSAAYQERVRSLLIRAILRWRSLWADDDQIQPMLGYITDLVGKFEGRGMSLLQASSSHQWSRLKLAITELEEADTSTATHAIDGKKASKRKDAEVATHRSIVDNVYVPNPKIRRATHVEERRAERKELRCSKCGYSIFSSWYFIHPSGNKCPRVLRPVNGHIRCKEGRQAAHFVAVDGTPSLPDTPTVVDLCEHNRQRHHCVDCGGAHVCVHKRQRSHCSQCSGRTSRWPISGAEGTRIRRFGPPVLSDEDEDPRRWTRDS